MSYSDNLTIYAYCFEQPILLTRLLSCTFIFYTDKAAALKKQKREKKKAGKFIIDFTDTLCHYILHLIHATPYTAKIAAERKRKRQEEAGEYFVCYVSNMLLCMTLLLTYIPFHTHHLLHSQGCRCEEGEGTQGEAKTYSSTKGSCNG